MGEGTPTVVAGDMNAMHGETAPAKLLRPARLVAERLPAKDPVPGEKQSKLSRAGSLGQRLVRMADGSTLRALQEAGFSDADPEFQPTMPSRYPFVQLDHIFRDRDVQTDPSTFTVYPHNPAADHRMVSVLVEAK
jgi:endonuclease/exonuclease/phosphatase family metal-dependent hydrolase